jgi:phosphopentomutase
MLQDGDLAVIAADHANDPTFRGSDHNPKASPDPSLRTRRRETLADIGETIADVGMEPGPHGIRLTL